MGGKIENPVGLFFARVLLGIIALAVGALGFAMCHAVASTPDDGCYTEYAGSPAAEPVCDPY